MQDKISVLKRNLEEKIQKNRPYDEIYGASIVLDEAINLHYKRIDSGVIRKKQQA